MQTAWRFCPCCAAQLVWRSELEDGGPRARWRCPSCDFTHWNNPTPVLAAIVELGGKVLLARNATWTQRFFGLITGFMEAGETPEEGVQREIAEETGLQVQALSLVAVNDFQPMNQVIITYHARAVGQVCLSPELAEYKLLAPEQVRCWHTGTGLALAQWLQSRGIEPAWIERPSAVHSQGSESGKPP